MQPRRILRGRTGRRATPLFLMLSLLGCRPAQQPKSVDRPAAKAIAPALMDVEPTEVVLGGTVSLEDGTPVEGVVVRATDIDVWMSCDFARCPFEFGGCMKGPATLRPEVCWIMDKTRDGRIDMRDVALSTR